MIVINIEMWPLGDETKKYPLGRMFIHNIGGSIRRGNYKFAIRHKKNLEIDRTQSVTMQDGNTRIGQITNHPRLAVSVWVLVKKCLEQAFPSNK